MALDVRMEFSNETAFLKMQGILDISTTHLLEEYIQKIEDVKELIIDFSGLEFIDSTGIGAIMEIVYRSQEKQFRIKLEGMDKQIYEILETVGLFKVLEMIQGRAV
ncbi:STAS domain-containing protein [Saccharococcus caldoxylosilyticus]|uniref:STAS domain-containing protein n=1 Tax=Saccharococcus caldoxylosilyticus TaxID=81408 RepID=UPI0002F51C40|nr:STAS domain-containing protein [Parageobacillus caldoxylosilyticus]